MSVFRLLPAALIAATVACDGATAPDAPEPNLALAGGVAGLANGGGRYDIAGVFDLQFGFSTILRADGSASGNFHHAVELSPGMTADFKGVVTCATVDAENGRAWIGGVITKNKSTDPGWQGGIFEPGKDIWFRVLDTGEASADPDRTTFVGFEGGGGIITSAQYCEAAIWPDDNERTWPVTRGSITVLP